MSDAALPPTEIALDVSELPRSVMGPRSLLWWGTLGFMLIEGTGFVLAAGVYIYLRGQAHEWPPASDLKPDLLWGGLFTGLLLLSAIPNVWLSSMARKKKTVAVRWGIALMTVLAIVLLVIRGFEFAHLNVRWDHDAYGSVVWLLIFVHATHVITDLGDTVILAAWLLTHKIGDDQFSDVVDNAGYWNFVILAWLPTYLLIYWGARWL